MPRAISPGDQKGRDQVNMAQKRMFSRQITDSDAFLDLPMSAQCLYFHASLSADDEGFISSAKRIARNIGADLSDLAALVDAGFLILFPDSGIYVDAYFWTNNTLKSDRFHPTNYQTERKQLILTENKVYQLVRRDGTETETERNQSGRQYSIGEYSPEEKREGYKSIDDISSGEGSSEGGTKQRGVFSDGSMDQNDLLLHMATTAGIRQELEPVLNRYGFKVAHDAYTAWKKAGAVIGKYKEYVQK